MGCPEAVRNRQDVWIWLASLAFLGALAGGIFGFGALRGWDAASGYTHNTSASSQARFLPEPFVPDPAPGRHGVDASGRWYYWKLPPATVTTLTRSIMWLCYVVHQLATWFGLYMLQREKMLAKEDFTATTPKARLAVYSTKLSPWNWFLFATNVFFHLVHLGQTHWTYDALAQDVSIASSQSSVIMLLIFILVIEYRDRGIFFGWPSQFDNGTWSKRLRLPYGPMYLVRKYHGYAFTWAAIYTFWYHPMENTAGHVMGFCHTYLLLVQASLAYTPLHLNKYWRFLLEVWVTAHGGVVAAQTGGPEQLGTKLWPMFVFGFLLIVVLTQLFGLPFWRKIHVAFRFLPLAIYLAVVIWAYSWIPDAQGRPWVRLQEPIRIPGVYYLYFFLVWAWTLLLLWIVGRCRGVKDNDEPVRPCLRWLAMVGVVFIYAVFVLVSALIQTYDVQINMITLMILLVGLFSLGVCLTNILFQAVFSLFGGSINISDSCAKGKVCAMEDRSTPSVESHEQDLQSTMKAKEHYETFK